MILLLRHYGMHSWAPCGRWEDSNLHSWKSYRSGLHAAAAVVAAVCEALLLLLLLSLTPKTKPPYLKFLLHKKKKNTVLQIFNKPRPKSSVLSYKEIEFLDAAIVDGKHFLRSGSRENLTEEIMNDGSSISGMQQHYCIRLSSTNTHLYVHVYDTCMYIYTYIRYVFVVVCIWDMYVYVCVGLALVGKDIVLFIIEYSSLRIFSP